MTVWDRRRRAVADSRLRDRVLRSYGAAADWPGGPHDQRWITTS